MTDDPASGWVMAWAGDGDQALLEVTASGAAALAVAAHAASLATDGVASRLAARDSGLWGPHAQAASARHLGWTELHLATRGILPELAALRAELTAAGLDRVVVAASAPAAEVIAATAGVGLVTCDPADPGRLRAALAGDLARTVVVLSSRSDPAHDAHVHAVFTAAGLDATRHVVVVPDRGSALERASRAAGYRVFPVDPNITGPFGALSARAGVPAALAGADVGALLDQAAAVADILVEDAESNPALVLAAAIAGTAPRARLAVVEAGSGAVGLADWVTWLVDQSTHVRPGAADTAAHVLDVRLVALVDEVDDAPAQTPDGDEVTVAGALGAQFLLWQYAAVVAALMLGVNPFQPDAP